MYMLRDDKRRKAFRRDGNKRPKEPPQYEIDLLETFHTETRRRFADSEIQEYVTDLKYSFLKEQIPPL